MHYTTIAVAAFSTAAAAAGQATILNNCDFDVWLWSVGDNKMTDRGAFKPGKTWTEDLEEGTHEIKIAKGENGIADGSPQGGLVYAVSEDTVSYELYHVLGEDFGSMRVADDTNCRREEVPEGSGIEICSSESNVTLNVCGDKEE